MGRKGGAMQDELDDLSKAVSSLTKELTAMKHKILEHEGHIEVLYENVANDAILTKVVKNLVAQDEEGEEINDILLESNSAELRENLVDNLTKTT
jgi:hypothetical protein